MTFENETLKHEDYDKTFSRLKLGQLVTGTVVKVCKDEILVDINYKTDAVIPFDELSFKYFSSPEEIVKTGDLIQAIVVKYANKEGQIVLSKKRADLESNWLNILNAYEKKLTVTGAITKEVKGGLIVNLGIQGFLPASCVSLKPINNLSDLLGEVFEFKIIQIDTEKRRVVLSRKEILLEEQKKLEDELWDNIHESAIIKAKISRLTNFGAFADLGGLEGLIHISEISHKRIKHPSELLSQGQEVEVFVLKFDKNTKKISLSLKQTLPGPWTNICEKYSEGGIYNGKISKIAKKYIFVELEDGIEGLVPLNELLPNKNTNPNEFYNIDQEITVKILEIKPAEKRLLLSLKQAVDDFEKAQYEEYIKNNDNEGSFTIGEILKKQIGGIKT